MKRVLSGILIFVILLAPIPALATEPTIQPYYTSFSTISSAFRFIDFYVECDWLATYYPNSADKLTVDARLEIFKDGYWQNVTTFSHSHTSNSALAAVSYYYFPSKGEYRLVSVFSAYKNGVLVEADTLISYNVNK